MMKEKWQQLSLREKRLAIITSIVAIITLVYFMIWEPLQDGIQTSRVRVKAQQDTLVQMREQAAEARQLLAAQRQAGANTRSSSSLLVIIERTAQTKKLKSRLQKVQPEGQDSVRVWIENASFDQLIDWLALLENSNTIYVSEIIIDRQKEPGRVNSRILLRVAS
jgi:general secretion pathway protein M